MVTLFSTAAASTVLPPLVSGFPSNPSAGHFWAVITWVIFPAVCLVWGSYFSRKERLRGVHRKLRQLEIRLAAATPATAAVRAALPRPAPSHRPSSLTARLLLPASAATAAIPAFPHSAPGQTG